MEGSCLCNFSSDCVVLSESVVLQTEIWTEIQDAESRLAFRHLLSMIFN